VLDSGRTTWLFPVEEILPLGGSDGSALIERVANRYQFANFPEKIVAEEVAKNGIKFTLGKFESEGHTVNVGEFAIFEDGIVAISNTTERSEAFLRDVYTFLRTEAGFREITSKVKKINLSVVVVELNESLSVLMEGRGSIMNTVGHHLNAIENTQDNIEVGRIDFVLNRKADPKSQNLPRLTIERRSGSAFEQRRFYSSAPLTTQEHLVVLEQIDAALSGRAA
jgi:hypothetical protein